MGCANNTTCSSFIACPSEPQQTSEASKSVKKIVMSDELSPKAAPNAFEDT
ncbi:hypothetical protein P3T21_005360 [Paraburkholderia sp. GAS334]